MDDIKQYLIQLEKTKGPNAVGNTGDPIIIVHVKRREEDDVLRLLIKGANPNAIGYQKETLLQLAIEYQMEEVSKRLLISGVDPNEIHAYYTPTPLFRAARSGNNKLVKLLLEHGALVDQPSYANETPLMSASESDHLEVCKTLLEAGAGLEKTSKSGWTPLIHAGMGGHVSIAKLLLSYGANPNSKDEQGYNATDWARRKHDGMLAQGFRDIGIKDHYDIEGPETKVVSNQIYDIFISYKQHYYKNDADTIRNILLQHGKKVFVDRYELELDSEVLTNPESIKLKLKQALQNTTLTLFFEMFWNSDQDHSDYADKQLNWQYFELLNSKSAVLLSPQRQVCEKLVIVPGEKLRTEEGFEYDDYSYLCEQLLITYF